MANVITIDTLLDDSVNTIFKVNFALDGTALSNYVIYDPATHFNKGTLLKLMRISYELTTFNIRLIWDGTPTDPIITLASNHHEDIDYEWCGGLRNDLAGIPNGKIYANFVGQEDGDKGHLIIHLKHRD